MNLYYPGFQTFSECETGALSLSPRAGCVLYLERYYTTITLEAAHKLAGFTVRYRGKRHYGSQVTCQLTENVPRERCKPSFIGPPVSRKTLMLYAAQ